MAANQPPGSLSKQASEKDFDRISQTIGSNWEMLAPYLLKENPTVTVEQIKDDHRLTRQRIRQLLLTWSQQTAPDATLGQLFYQMFQAGSSVNISWKSIAEKLNIDYKAVIACKHGYQHPVQESSADQTPETGRQNVADQLPIQVSSVERMEVDSLHVAHGEKMEVDEDQGDGRVLKDGNQTDHSSLFEKQKNKTYRAPIKACIFDGRLIKLEEDDINILDKKYIKKIGEGNFGKVYSTSDNSVHEGFGLRIAVKKMSLDGSDAHTRMVRREMIASRIMHPFVLPLLAVIDHPKGKPEAWFVSPLCENGDLFHAIKNGKIEKNKTKVKILLHIALAIQYIHTKVPKVRDVILHKDIASKNVLLDANFNARLIDFGLAREKDDSTATASGRIHYCHPHIGKGKGATESWDYFSFGVIIREMLTNLEPKGSGKFFLKEMPYRTVEELCNWSAKSAAKKLNIIATICLEKLEMNLQEFEEIAVQGIRDILQRDLNQDRIIDIPDDNTKCHICMINPKASKTSMTQEHQLNCRQKVEACIACERNSFLNPIRCYCDRDLRPVIGKDGYQHPVQESSANQTSDTGVLEDVDGNQTDRSLLVEKQKSKSYRPPINACIFDGRLIKLEEDDINTLDKCYGTLIGEGSFGKVYSTSDNSVHKGFGIRIAVKKISLDGDESRERTVRREMIASRIMHPFVLPLLAVIDRPNGKPEVWFVSPRCENGDLFHAIKNGKIEKNKTKVKILLHIALAIQYIHTKVPKVRDAILHKDIASQNVLLDANFNARLIDFGLAREKNDKSATTSHRTYYIHPDVGEKEKRATESWDYFSFGVIIREMLTDLGPVGKDGNFLRKMPYEDVEKLCKWPVKAAVRKLNDIAKDCLEKREMNLEEFEKNTVKGIKDIFRSVLNQDRIMDIPDDNTKCHICMINPKARKTSMTQTQEHQNCRQNVEACIACERNSFLNPIRCFYCDTDLKPVIGCGWGALLVAGNDTENTVVAEALKKDINMLKRLITSRAPHIMGISEDKVRTVVPDRPGKSDKEQELLWPKVKECIDDFSKENEVDTLLIYFSCHGAKEVGQGDVNDKHYFKLCSLTDSKDSISFTEFEKELEKLEMIDKLVIILDCCYPVFVQFKNRDRKYIQFNACKSDKKADIRDEGSIFTKYLIQGLKACSEEKRCSKSCKPCKDYWSERSDFISVKSLIEYVNSHMNKGPEEGLITHADGSNIAFYTDEKVEIDFTCGQQKETVSLEYLQEMGKLEEKLFEVFGKDKNQFKIRIQKDTYRTEDRLQDCDTLEKVMSAWVHRQPLKVFFEGK